MKIALPIRSILKPSYVSMAAVLASFAAWLFPSFGVLRKGFDHPEQLDLTSFVVLACWYMLIFVSFLLGQKLGELNVFARKGFSSSLLNLESNFIYYCFTFLAALGIITTLVRIFRTLSLQQAVLFIALGQANQLINTLYEDYSIGIVSLRYLVLYSASIALYRIVRFRSFSFLNILNVLMLMLSVLMSSRLIFIATLVVTVFILSFGARAIKISIPKIALSVGIIFLALSALNVSRNAGFYESKHLSFGLAGLSEILTYLGSPFQAAIASAKITDQVVAGVPYRNYTDLEESLNTNSAFVLLHQQMGYLAWIYIAMICAFMGFVFEALLSLGKTIFLLPCGAILYGSSELWRLDLFHQGTFIVWFVIGIGLPASLMFAEHLRGFVKRLYAMPRSSAG